MDDFNSSVCVAKNKRATLERIEKYISSVYFTDCNLRGRLFKERIPIESIYYRACPLAACSDDSSSLVPSTYDDVNDDSKFEKISIGFQMHKTWSAHWIRLDVTIPEKWMNEEVHLFFDCGGEALLWENGQPVQGLSGAEYQDRKNYVLLKKGVKATETQLRRTLYIQVSCTGMFGAGAKMMIAPPETDRTCTLQQAELVVVDRAVRDLILDLEVFHDMAKHLPEQSHRGFQALYLANQIVNRSIQPAVESSLVQCHLKAAEFFAERNGESQLTLYAAGHCHIDTAWLWRYKETVKKCARSWSSVLQLMEDYPELVFACSQAQQFEWVKEFYPDIFSRIQHMKDRFVPVGGTWVEMDGNIPSGESFVRQFLYGQRFFEENFGAICNVFWLPDTFGYSAQLPQICKLSGVDFFLTQKISWNLVNKFPHHTFWWEGIDGSRMVTHFPPGDSYGMEGKVEELLKTSQNCLDKGRVREAVYLFGFGDGGGGPTADMIERLRRMQDNDGIPRVKFASPYAFFDNYRTASKTSQLCTWRGELYLELHQGTFTTHANVKRSNRKCEFALRNAETISSWNMLTRGHLEYPQSELNKAWKKLLLNQFHDVLPGTSIQTVYEDVHQYYKEIADSCNDVIERALAALLTGGQSENVYAVNTLSWTRREVVTLPNGENRVSTSQTLLDGSTVALAEAPSFGYAVIDGRTQHSQSVAASQNESGEITVENGILRAIIDAGGRVVSLKVKAAEKEFIEAPANQFVLFDDVPLYWDAWDVMDYHLETRQPLNCTSTGEDKPRVAGQFACGFDVRPRIVDNGPLRVCVELKFSVKSQTLQDGGDVICSIHQTISLDVDQPYLKFSTKASWKTAHKFLKVEFPLNIHTDRASYDIQFGYLDRPTHGNTSWDSAKYEVCAHKWVDCSEFGFGVALLNDCKHGHSVRGGNVSLSLLRSPKNPDSSADVGLHEFTYALMPHRGPFQSAGVVQAAYELNCPLLLQRAASGGELLCSFFGVDNPAVILDTIKKSEDGHRLVVRLYESYGGETAATLTVPAGVVKATKCDLLERPICDLQMDGCRVPLHFRAFEIQSLLLNLS